MPRLFISAPSTMSRDPHLLGYYNDAGRLPAALIPAWCFPRNGVLNHRENTRLGFNDYPANGDDVTEGVSYHWYE